jgi:hypothetical protein
MYPRDDDFNVTTEETSITTIEDVWNEIELRSHDFKNCGKILTLIAYRTFLNKTENPSSPYPQALY